MAIPLRDIQPRRTYPYVTTALVVINAAAFLYELSLGSRLNGMLQQVAFVPAVYDEPGNFIADNRSILVSMFLHGGWAHILGNMLYLWIFGDNVEDRLGHLKYLLFYFACGWAATVSHAWANPQSTTPAIGASGAIAGVLGAYLMMFPRARVVTLIPLGFFLRLAELPAILVLGFWFVLQLFSGVASLGARTSEGGGVAFWAHIGGFVVGLAVGLVARALRLGERPRYR